MLRTMYDRLPLPLRSAARSAFYQLRRLANPAQHRWIAQEYEGYARSQREEMMLAISRFCHINRPMKGYYFEFGCHEANTMRLAWRHTRYLFDWTYVAFNSFEGLPEIQDVDRQDVWQKGKLKTGEQEFIAKCRKAGMPQDRLITIRGFFEQSLDAATQQRLAGRKAVVIYVDCDLYHSTVPVLKFMKHFLQPGTIVVFDDWLCFHCDPDRGERRAWAEFLAANPDLKFVPFIGTAELQSFVFIGVQVPIAGGSAAPVADALESR